MKVKRNLIILLSMLSLVFFTFAAGMFFVPTRAVETTFESFEINFDDSADKDLFTNANSGTAWKVENGLFSNGTSSWAEMYLTGKAIQMSTGDYKTVVEVGFFKTEETTYFNIGVISAEDYTNNKDASLNFGSHATNSFLRIGRVGNFNASWLAQTGSATLGYNVLSIELNNGNAAFLLNGNNLSSKNSNRFDVNAVTGDNFYLDFCMVQGGCYIDYISVYQDIKEDAIIDSEVSFDGLDSKQIATVNKDLFTGYSRINSGANSNVVGADYFAVDVKSTADAETGILFDLTEGINTGSYGHWWTAAENLKYYLDDGTSVKEGMLVAVASKTNNRAYARVPAGFTGKVIFPINSFEILSWSINESDIVDYTEDANAMNLSKLAWFDIYGEKLKSTSGALTVNSLSIIGKELAGSEVSVASTVRAISDIGVVTAASESQIYLARTRYDSLSELDKADVSNYQTLLNAESAYYSLVGYSNRIATAGKDFTGGDGVVLEGPFEKSPSTVSAWIKVDRDIADNTHVGTVFGNMGRTQLSSALYDTNNSFSMEITTNGNPKFEWRVSRNHKISFVVENADVRTGSWLYLAFVRNTVAKQIECYINGTLVGVYGGVNKAYIADIEMKTPAIIGSDYTDDDVIAVGYTPDFNGEIAFVRAYANALNENQINLDMVDELTDGELLAGVDFLSGSTKTYYNKTGDSVTDNFGWKEIDVSELYAKDGEYVMAVQGDTQMYLSKAVDNQGNDIYVSTTSTELDPNYDKTTNMMYKNNNFLVDNKENLNLQFAMHMGDLTDFLNYPEWATKGVVEFNLAMEYMDILSDGGINWSMSRGNHDGGGDPERIAVYEAGYTHAKYGANVSGYYGDSANMLNTYYNFEVGSTKYTVIALDLEPSDEVLAWAKGVADANADRRVIVTTHTFMGGSGTLNTSTMTSGNAGAGIWEKFVSKCPNVILVLSGHEDPVDITRVQLVGDNGNTVWSIVVDESTLNFNGNRQVGTLALMKFSADGSTVQINFYSPSEGKLYKSINQFEIELDIAYFNEKDNVYTEYANLDFTDTADADYFVNGTNNGNFEVKDGAFYAKTHYGVSMLSQPIPTKGIYEISFDANLGQTPVFYAGLLESLAFESITTGTSGSKTNLCFGRASNVSAIFKSRFESGYGWTTGLYSSGSTYINYNDGNTHSFRFVIVDGVVTIFIDYKLIGTYDNMASLENMYFGLRADTTNAGGELPYIDNFKFTKGSKLTLDFSDASQGNGFVKSANSNGNFTVSEGKLIPAANWGVGLLSSVPISNKGTYKISMDFCAGTGTDQLFIGFTNSSSAHSSADNFALGTHQKNYFTVYSGQIGSITNGVKAYSSINVKDGNVHSVIIDIVDGITRFTLDGTILDGSYDYLSSTAQRYLAFHASNAATTYIDNIVVEYLPSIPKAEELNSLYDNYGDVVYQYAGELSGALPTLSKAGHVFIGYSIDGALYPAGYNLDSAEGNTIIAVFSKFSSYNGGSVKAVGGEYGIRFSNYIDDNSKAYLTNAVFGSVLAHTDTFTDGFDYSLMTLDNLTTYDMRSIVTEKFATVKGYTVFHTVIDKLKDINREFACVGYITITYADESVQTVYSLVTDNKRTIKQLAQKALEEIVLVESEAYCEKIEGLGYSMLTVGQRNTLMDIIGE